MGKREKHDAITGWMFMLPFALMYLLVFLIPIAVAIYSSFFAEKASGGGLLSVKESTFVGFGNYADVIFRSNFWSGIGRVMAYTAIQVPVMILGALALALVLDSLLVRRGTVFRIGYFLPFAIPGLIGAIVWNYLYSKGMSPIVSVLETLGVDMSSPTYSNLSIFQDQSLIIFSMANITTWTFTGYNMLIFLAALQAIPHDLYEAARLDGATGFQIVTKIKIPMVRGAALLAVLLSIVGTIQIFNEPQVMQIAATWMPQDYTPMMMAYNTMRDGVTGMIRGDGPAAAVSVMMALVAGVLALIYLLVDRKVGGED
ncbi:MAG: sugar ABC transporter permease [Arcanobacterium sp.]|nr:sugar ABC transporter permease [Arcanobacterium sp.]